MSSQVRPIDPNDVQVRPHRYFRRKYVWQLPVRLYHWVNAISITALFLTGLYIAWPYLLPSGEAYNKLVMGTVRKVHFIFAFIFMVNFLVRIYWFFFGNNYARTGFPFIWRRDWWSDLWTQAKDYVKLERGHVHLGHNSMGGLAYTVCVIGLTWLQIFSGMALYSQSNPGGILDSLFGWVILFAGGSFQLHMWHHLFSWGFLVFAILHVYIVAYDGSQYKNGLVTSIVSGVKFYQSGDFDQDKWLG